MCSRPPCSRAYIRTARRRRVLAIDGTDRRGKDRRYIGEPMALSRGYLWGILSLFAIVLGGMAFLLLRFYSWVFFPIRSLQQGVDRVARGDFDHPILLHSGDELQELSHQQQAAQPA